MFAMMQNSVHSDEQTKWIKIIAYFYNLIKFIMA